MKKQPIDIIKYSGERVEFSVDKLRNSLRHTNADNETIEYIIEKVSEELYDGISTKEIYNRAFNLLKKQKSHLASRYKLKRAIYELGPTGFPFERFIGSILKFSGYETEVGRFIQGKCVSHEIDVVAQKNNHTTIIECKFHGEQGLKCNVKVPLYIHSRYQDVKTHWESTNRKETVLNPGWVVTNTRFTNDAMLFGKCVGLYLLSWDHPKNDSLKERIDRLGLYPITVSSLLSKREKQFLLNRNIVLCRELIGDHFYLDHLGISQSRQQKIISEIETLCKI